MKDFEKFLNDLPKPAVEVPAFRDQLRRELLSVAPHGFRPVARAELAVDVGHVLLDRGLRDAARVRDLPVRRTRRHLA